MTIPTITPLRLSLKHQALRSVSGEHAKTRQTRLNNDHTKLDNDSPPNSTMPNRFTKHPRPSQKRSEVDTPICEYEYCRRHRTFLMAGVGTAQCLPRVSRIRSVRPLGHRQQGVTGNSRQNCSDTITVWNNSESFSKKRE